MARNNLLGWFVVLFFVFSIGLQYYVYNETSQAVEAYQVEYLSGKSSQAVVRFCINNPPEINLSCSSNATQGQLYQCQVNASDPNNDTLVFSSLNLTNPWLFNISSSGLISFTANDSHVGNHSYNITVNDTTGCSNGVDTEVFNVSVTNVNDPPVLYNNINDLEFPLGDYYFFLADHIMDPDGDVLEFIPFGTVSGLSISVDNNASHGTYTRVRLTATSCVDAYPVWFLAVETDTNESYSVESNLFRVTIQCQDSGGNDQDQSGSGGGSGRERTCEPDWQCGNWGACRPNGTQTRRCIDYNGCDPDDYIRYHTRECYYPLPPTCEEEWECSAWGPCIDGNQTRTCTDNNKCGTFLLMPNTTQSCVVSQSETPTPRGPPEIDDRFPWLTYILIMILLVLAILITVYKVYKKQIKELVVRLGWYLTKKRRKSILLTEEQKNVLLSDIAEVEKHVARVAVEKSAYTLADIARQYFSFVLKLPHEFSQDAFTKAAQNKKLDELLRKVFISFFATSFEVEFAKRKLRPYELLTFIDELRLLIFQTSNATRQDAEKQVKHRKTVSTESIDQVFTLLSNAMIPTQFNETVYGKKHALEALKAFEDLPLSQQEHVYPYLSRLFVEINYVSHLVQTAKLE